LTLESTVRNRLVNEHLNTALKSKRLLSTQQFANRITTGNTTDDMAKLPMSIGLSKLLERLDIKTSFEQVEKYRGYFDYFKYIWNSIHFMSEGRSEDFQKRGTHFFNPARYLKLFEIIPGPATSQEIGLSLYGEKF
jgi:3-hydroxyacyl-CoA dehydrogenase